MATSLGLVCGTASGGDQGDPVGARDGRFLADRRARTVQNNAEYTQLSPSVFPSVGYELCGCIVMAFQCTGGRSYLQVEVESTVCCAAQPDHRYPYPPLPFSCNECLKHIDMIIVANDRHRHHHPGNAIVTRIL